MTQAEHESQHAEIMQSLAQSARILQGITEFRRPLAVTVAQHDDQIEALIKLAEKTAEEDEKRATQMRTEFRAEMQARDAKVAAEMQALRELVFDVTRQWQAYLITRPANRAR